MRTSLIFLLLVPMSPLGCAVAPHAAEPMVRVRASSDLDCPQKDIRLEPELGGSFKAVGCGRKTTYRTACDHLSCVVHGEDEPLVPWKANPERNAAPP